MSQFPSENPTCRICGNSREPSWYSAKEMMYGLRKTFTYFQCSKCQCLQILEIPREMEAYYPADYYSFGRYDGKKFRGIKGTLKKFQYKNSVLGNSFFRKLFGIKEYKIFEGAGVGLTTSILDVGCGNGKNFLYPLAEAGFRNLLGCDPFISETIVYENGLTIMKAGVSEITGEWDIITYHHAFEHLPDPLENMKKIHELLAPDGLCIIRIPTVSSFAWETYKTDWVQLDAPRHFFLHSRESMKLLAMQAGLTLEKVIYDSTHFQFTGSEKYRRDIPLSAKKERGWKAWFKRKADKIRYQRKALQLNKAGAGDQAAFFFRKK